jgi:hypothetical protein
MKYGKQWIITMEAMVREYGEPKSKWYFRKKYKIVKKDGQFLTFHLLIWLFSFST